MYFGYYILEVELDFGAGFEYLGLTFKMHMVLFGGF